MKDDRPLGGYRPVPRDFVEAFIRVGWEGIEAECRAHKTTIRRWIAQLDEQAMAADTPLMCEQRRTFLEVKRAAEGRRVDGRRPDRERARRYVLGRTLSAVNPTPAGE